MHYRRLCKHGDVLYEWSPDAPAQAWLAEHVTYSGGACLPWPFHVADDGYGRAHHPVTNALMTASRLMCTMAHGEPPSEKHQAAHSCGNGHNACANPRHLYWATHTINQGDRVAHGTTNRGSRQWKAKLTEADVTDIRARLAAGDTQASIARHFDIDASVISDIKRRKKWGWLP